MNWYLKNIEKTYLDKIISAIADNGSLVNGKFEKIIPDARRGYLIAIKDSKENRYLVKASNIRGAVKIDSKKDPPKENKVKVNFCGMLYEGYAPESKTDTVKTRVMTTKEPHTLKKIEIMVPSTHITNEDK